MSGWNHSQKILRRPCNRLWLRVLLPGFVWLLCQSAVARAATFAVDRTDDNALATACTAAANDCSLRGAIIKANTDAVQDTITLQANQTYTLTIGPADSIFGAIVEASGDLNVTAPLTINGNGATINGGGIDRVFSIRRNPESTFTATFNNLTIKGGAAQGQFSFGGGINVRAATLNLNSCVVTANTTSESGATDNGGGIAVNGVLSPAIKGGLNLVDCTVSGNTGYNGGGIAAGSSTVTITRSTLSGNTANGTTGGGGIFICGSNSSVQVYNSTLSGNASAGNGGGLVAFEGVVAVASSTITKNATNLNGGGICRLAGTTAVGSSIVAGNFGLTPDVSGAFSTSGYNVIGRSDGSTGFNAATDHKGTNATPLDPLLGPLQNNGGATATHALLPGSPAVNAGNTSHVELNGERHELAEDLDGAGYVECELDDANELIVRCK